MHLGPSVVFCYRVALSPALIGLIETRLGPVYSLALVALCLIVFLLSRHLFELLYGIQDLDALSASLLFGPFYGSAGILFR